MYLFIETNFLNDITTSIAFITITNILPTYFVTTINDMLHTQTP